MIDDDPDRFDFDGLFDADYLHFYASYLTGERAVAEAQLVASLLDARAGEALLDLACGHGRIGNELAKLGLEVTGVDRSEPFLEAARAAAAELGVSVEYACSDLRELAWVGRFDKAVCWFTSFGYFDDAENRDVLVRTCRALRPGGRFLVETMNLHQVVEDPAKHAVKRVADEFMIDDKTYDPGTGRLYYRRTIVRNGTSRSMRFFVRLFTVTELRDWLLQAGFSRACAYGGDGEPFEVDSERMILVADK
jgi:SAM-dependent methyltransferase